MPTLVWLYLTALLYYRTSATCVAFAEALQTVSHDRLIRVLQADWSGQTLLESAFRTLFKGERGYLSSSTIRSFRSPLPGRSRAWHGPIRAKRDGRCLACPSCC
jgi:hypothetical protein